MRLTSWGCDQRSLERQGKAAAGWKPDGSGPTAVASDPSHYFGGVLVEIDARPGAGSINLPCNNEHVIITLPLLTTDDFDALTVDHTTVMFEGATEAFVNKKSGEPRRFEDDVDGDGDIDLVFHFRLGDTSLTCSSTEGTLTGETYDGTPILGTVALNVIGGN